MPTPWQAVLVLVEISGIIFPADSIPAILAVSRGPFLASLRATGEGKVEEVVR